MIILTLLHSDWCGLKLKTPCILNMCHKWERRFSFNFGWSTLTVKFPGTFLKRGWKRSGRQKSPPRIDYVKNVCLRVEVLYVTEKFCFPVLSLSLPNYKKSTFLFCEQRGKTKLTTFFYIQIVGLKNSPNHLYIFCDIFKILGHRSQNKHLCSIALQLDNY